MPLANKSRCLQRGMPRSVSGKELVDAGVWPSTTLARGRPPTVRTSPWRGSRSRNPLHRQVKTLAPPEIPVWGRGRLTASQADGVPHAIPAVSENTMKLTFVYLSRMAGSGRSWTFEVYRPIQSSRPSGIGQLRSFGAAARKVRLRIKKRAFAQPTFYRRFGNSQRS